MRKGIVSLFAACIGSSACAELGEESGIVEDVTSTTDDNLTRLQRISYRAHVQNVGWQAWVNDPGMAGTVGQSRRLEAIEIVVTRDILNFGICYEANVAGNWQLPVCNGGTMGTTGQHQALSEVAIWLDPHAPATTNCHLQYRVHLGGIGWHPWVDEGMPAGCPGCSMQAVEIRFVDRTCT